MPTEQNQILNLSAKITRLPSDEEAEFNRKITSLEKVIEQQKGMIANFVNEIELKNKMIAEYDSTASNEKVI